MTRENIPQYIILGLLAHEDMSGYDLKKKIDLMISQFWEVGYGQIYPNLKVLEQEGAITGRSEVSDLGPDRIVYSITDKGRGQLADWLRQPVSKEHVRYEILLKTFFGGLLSPADTREKIADFGRRSTESFHLLEQFEQNLLEVLPNDPDHLYFYLTVLFGKKVYQAYQNWALEADQLIEKYFEESSRNK